MSQITPTNDIKIFMNTPKSTALDSSLDHDKLELISDQSQAQTEAQTFIHSNKRNFGTHIPFLYVGREPFFTIGPDWTYFLCMWLSLIVIGVMVNIYVAAYLSDEIIFLTRVVTFIEAFIYLLTSLRNPGIISKFPLDVDEIKHSENPSFCKKCKIIRTNEIYHCVDCDVCISGFDHHCPWTGKCIGENNLKLFYMFLGSTLIYIFYCIIITCIVTASIGVSSSQKLRL